MKSEMANISVKLDSLMAQRETDNEDKTRDDLKELKREIQTISEKLKTHITSGEEENNLKQMKKEIAHIKEKLDNLINRLPLEEKQLRMEVSVATTSALDSGGSKGARSALKRKHAGPDPKRENLKETHKQMRNQVENVFEKLDSLRGSLLDEEKLQEMKSEIGNMIEKLDSLMAQRETGDEDNMRDHFQEMTREIRTISKKLQSQMTREEGNSRDNLEQMKKEIAHIKEKLDNLINRLPLEEKKLRMEDDFDPAEIIDSIRQLYKVREGWLAPFPWCEEFHFHLDSIFTRLKVVSRKKTRGTATDNIVNMSGIFKPHEECPQPRTVLIEGKPGMGKTTYCKKMVYDWASGKQEADDCFPRFDTVLLLKCRDMKSGLWEAIDDQVLPRDVEEDVREKFFNFIRQNQSDVLLVLDGLDEVPTSKLPMVTEIIQGRRELPKCRMVATARHEAGIKLRIHCDTLLQIEGFTLEDAREFIFKYFKDMKNLAKELMSKLESDKNLRDMVANPLNTALLCLICEEFGGNFPERRTQLYEEIIQCILRRYRKKIGLPETNEDLFEVYDAQLKHLGQIALSGLLEDKLDFEESELKSPAELPGFGLLSVQTGGSKLRPRRHYSFLHKSFQECFAAFYLCCQLLNGEISVDKLTADRRYLKGLREVLLFTCGMVATRCKETAEALIKSITAQVNETEQLGERKEEWLLALLESISECRREDDNFHLKMARVSGSFLKLQSLCLFRQSTSMTDVVLLAEVIKVNSTVTELTLNGNNIGDEGATGLAEALKVNSTLTYLRLYSNNIGDQVGTGLAEALKVNSTLTELDLQGSKIGDQGVTGLAEALKVNSTLTWLNLGGNNIGDQGATGLAEALKVNSTLTELILADNNIGDEGATGLAEALKVNSTLTELDLEGNNIGDQGATGLAEALKVNSTLTELDLEGNNIGDQGATGLAEALRVNSTLTELDLERNKIGDQGATGLAEALKVNSTLAGLTLAGNNIGDQGATGLAEALKVNSTLTGLTLKHNNIGETVRSELHLLQHDGLIIVLYPSYPEPGYTSLNMTVV